MAIRTVINGQNEREAGHKQNAMTSDPGKQESTTRYRDASMGSSSDSAQPRSPSGAANQAAKFAHDQLAHKRMGRVSTHPALFADEYGAECWLPPFLNRFSPNS